MNWKLFVLVAALISIASAPAFAQNPSVTAGASFRVRADHDGSGVSGSGSGYRLFLCSGVVTTCATQQQQVGPGARSGGVVTFADVPGLPRGTYSLQASAFNADAETKSAVLVFDSRLAAPGPMGLPQLVAITQAADGSIGIRLLDADAARELLRLPPIAAAAERDEPRPLASHRTQ